MSRQSVLLPAGEALTLASLVTPTPHGIASRILAKTGGGSATLFAFDAGQDLSEHTTPADALVLMLEGLLVVTVGGVPVSAVAGQIVRLPANVPHAIEAREASRMLLIMLREPAAPTPAPL